MDENLVGYLLNALDPKAQREVDEYLDTHPDAQERLQALRQTLAPLDADRANIDPPKDLVYTTLARVAEHICRDATRPLPRAPVTAKRSWGADRPRWRRLDVLVAAGLLLTIIGLSVPWVMRQRWQSGEGTVNPVHRVACEYNLKKIYDGLKVYSDLNGKRFPDVADAALRPHNVAGLVMPLLIDKGFLKPEDVTVTCPANDSQRQPCIVKLPDLLAMDEDEFKRLAPTLLSCYAYSLGYREGDVFRGLRLEIEQPNALLPIMADCPPAAAESGNSSNHGGSGQNVLFLDGHVKFYKIRLVGKDGDDIYVNKEGKVAAGLDCWDTVLGRSESKP